MWWGSAGSGVRCCLTWQSTVSAQASGRVVQLAVAAGDRVRIENGVIYHA